MTSGGTSEIDINSYDMFWLVGVGFALSRFMGPLHSHRLFEDRIDGVPIMSRAAFDMATAVSERPDVMENLARFIRSVSQTPIIAIPAPMPGETILDDPMMGPMWAGSFPEMMMDRFSEIGARIAQNGATIYRQDPKTLRKPWLTKREYVIHSIKRGPNEYFHMNSAYGRIVVEGAMRLANSSGRP